MEKLIQDTKDYFSTYYSESETVRAKINNIDFCNSVDEFKTVSNSFFENFNSNDTYLIVYSELAGNFCLSSNKTLFSLSDNFFNLPSESPIETVENNNFFYIFQTKDLTDCRDQCHKICTQFLISMGVFPKKLLESDSDEELIFGDDELGFL